MEFGKKSRDPSKDTSKLSTKCKLHNKFQHPRSIWWEDKRETSVFQGQKVGTTPHIPPPN